MNESPPKIISLVILVLCLVASTQIVSGQADRPREIQPGSRTWEKVYSGTETATFRTVFSMPWREEKNSRYRWLWFGDDTGAIRFTLLDTNQSLDVDASKNRSGLALSKLDVDPSVERTPVSSILFLDEMKGYLLKGSRLYRTDNAGFQWHQVHQVPNGANRDVPTLQSIAITPSKRACMVGMYSLGREVTDSLLMCTEKSLDADTVQWKRIELPTQTQLWHISFIDEKNGWIVGAVGTIFKTEDGGKTWERVPTEAESLMQSYFIDQKHGWIVGRFGTILRTIDAGDHWDPVPMPLFAEQISEVHFRSIKFAEDKRTGWIVGDRGTILGTEDGGETWQLLQGPLPREGDADPNTIFSLFVDDKYCWAVGVSGPTSKSAKSTIWRYKWR